MGWQKNVAITYVTLAVVLLSCEARHSRHQRSMMSLVPNIDVCGPLTCTIGLRIVGGRKAELGEFPWMALIGYQTLRQPNSAVSWGCGGSLITESFVLSAAHCFHPQTVNEERKRPNHIEPTKVRLGELDLFSTRDGAQPQDFDIERFKFHEDYNLKTKLNDIALVKLKGSVIFSRNIKPICLPPIDFIEKDYVGKNALIAGWGRTAYGYGASRSNALLQTDVEIKDTDICRRNVTKEVQDVVINNEKVICASAHGKDACQGDSGGPLMYSTKIGNADGNSKKNIFVMGIVSYGYKCAEEGYPAVYTRVSEHMEWIYTNLN